MTPKRVAVLLASVVVLGTLSPWLAPGRAHAVSRRRVVLAVWTEDPKDNLVFDVEDGGEPRDRLLRTLDARPGMSVGLLSSVQGGYIRKQAVLDISQGSRQPSGLYASPSDELELRAVPTGGGATIAGWEEARRRARDVSVTLRPGLLASSVPGGAGFVGTGGPDDDDEVAVVAANERGFVPSFSTGRADTIGARVHELLDARALVVVALPGGDAGRAALGDLVATGADGDLLFVMHLPRTPAKGEYGRAPARFYRLTATGLSGGVDGSLRSASTRRRGLVSATDVLPTVLEHLGRRVPDAVRGAPVRTTSPLGAERLEELRRRWSDVRDGRQSASLSATVGTSFLILLLLGTVRGQAGFRPGLRIGALSVMWWPTMVLVVAAFEPRTRAGETTGIALASVALGVLTDRILRWPRGPVIPVAVGLSAFTLDLATGGDVLTRSALGPSLVSGARFYGISNELEPLLPILLLLGLAALAGGRARSRGLCVIYGLSGLALGIVVGWGRLGADVGGVLTVAGGFAVATLLLLPGGLTRRALLSAALVPFLAIGALIALDLGLSGGSHLSRNLSRSEGITDLWELVARRYQLAWSVLKRGRNIASLIGVGLGIAFAVRNRAWLYAALPGRAWEAALVGGLACGVVGAFTNDSGPVLLTNSVIALAAVTAYVQGGETEAVRS